MNIPSPVCLKQDSRASELAALATVSRYYGLPLTLSGIRKLTGFGKQSLDGVQIMGAASQCGFTAVPLEGEFEQLPELPLPGVVVFREAQYQVLFQVDAESALIGDTASGRVERLSRAEFSARWTGDVYQVQPNDGLEAARETLRRLESPWWRLGGLLGIVPFAAGRIFFAISLCVWLAALAWATTLALLTSACLLISLWMAGWPKGCSRCGNSASLAGSLPLPWLGAGFYAALTAAILRDADSLFWPGLLTAAGAHAALAGVLLRHRTLCYPCLGLAATAWIALGLAFTRHTAGVELWILPVCASVAFAAITFAALAARNEEVAQMMALATSVAADEVNVSLGRARLVIYSWKTCPRCIFFKNVVRPLLADSFGDALEIQERDAGRMKVTVPLFFVTGSTRIALAAVPTEEMLPRISEAIQVALDPAAARVGALGGVQLIGFPAGKASPR